MKKIVVYILAAVFTFAFLTLSFAKDLAAVLKGDLGNAAKLSNNVKGEYYASSDNGSFVIATAHNLGTKIFATGSMTTKIWEKSFSSSGNSQLITEPNDNDFDNETKIFSGFTEK